MPKEKLAELLQRQKKTGLSDEEKREVSESIRKVLEQIRFDGAGD